MNRPLVGLVVPSSNPTVERLVGRSGVTARLGVDVVSTRLRVRAIGADPHSDAQFRLPHLATAVSLLTDAQPDVVVWAGTSGFWRGATVEDDELAELTGAAGVPVTSSRVALLAALADIGTRSTGPDGGGELASPGTAGDQAGPEAGLDTAGSTDHRGAGSIGVVTPYVPAVHDAVVQSLTDAGCHVAAQRALGETDNLAFSRMGADVLRSAVSEASAGGHLPVAVVCTNVLGVLTGMDTVDSVVATLWHAAVLTGACTCGYREVHTWVTPYGPGETRR